MTENDFVQNALESDLPSSAKLILLILLRFRNRKTGECYPSITSIADASSLGTTCVKENLSVLREHGFIEIDKIRPKHAKFICNNYIIGLSTQSLSDQSNVQSGDQSPVQTLSVHKPIEPIEPIKQENIYTPFFDEFWLMYPKKVAKEHARKAYERARKVADHETIISGLRRYAESRRGQDNAYTANAATWLNGRRWSDEIINNPKAATINGKSAYGDSLANAARAVADNLAQSDDLWSEANIRCR